jgi:hypothetical protein
MMPTDQASALAALSTLAALLYVLTAGRLICYQPNGARHRVFVSLLATVTIAALMWRALEILLLREYAGYAEPGIAALLCVLAWLARGNVAALFRNRSDD